MHKTKFKQPYILILLLTGLLCFWSVEAIAQGSEPAAPETEVTNPPEFITELIESTDLTQEQVDQMRSDGAGWGNIMIATRLAERIAADSDGALTFDAALADVLSARTEGKGFGQIAHENDLKLERVVGNEDTPDSTNPPPFIEQLVDITDLTPEQVEQMRSDGAGEADDAPNLNHERIRIRNQEKKQNIFGRFINMLTFLKYYSTVTLFARLRGLSTSWPRSTAA